MLVVKIDQMLIVGYHLRPGVNIGQLLIYVTCEHK